MDRPESPALLPHFDDGKSKYFEPSDLPSELQVVMARDFEIVRSFTKYAGREEEFRESIPLLAALVNV